MVQAITVLSFIAEARVPAQVSLCGICGAPTSTGTGLYPRTSGFFCQRLAQIFHTLNTSFIYQRCYITLYNKFLLSSCFGDEICFSFKILGR
jgi:hypothetical protein